MLTLTNRFTAGEKSSIVTYNRSATPGKRRTTAVLLVSFDQCCRLRTVSVLTAASSSEQDLTPPFLLGLERVELLINYLWKVRYFGKKGCEERSHKIVQCQNVAVLPATFGLKVAVNYLGGG